MKVALLHNRSGSAGIWSPACEAAAIVGAAEINAAGGILGEEVELVFADSGMTSREALRALDSLLEIDQVDAVLGTHTSNLRDSVSERIGSRVPYIYTAQYEGSPVGPSTVAIGSTDPELMRPALHWLRHERHAQKFFFVGNDYIWPRMAYSTMRRVVREQGGEIVGSAFMPLGQVDHHDLLRRIAASGADVVVQALVGNCAILFNREFARAGLDEKHLRFALIVDETVICGIGADATTNLFSASSYFSEHRTRQNDRFLELYHSAFGEYAPPVSAASINVYEGLHVLAGLARDGGSRDPIALAGMMRRPMSRPAARHNLVDTPVGECPKAYLAIAEGLTFRVMAEMISAS